MKRRAVLALIILSLAVPASAHAGSYQVKACVFVPGQGLVFSNTSWFGEPDPHGFVAAYTGDCSIEGIMTRMTGGAGNAPYGVGGRQVFTAPPTTRVTRLQADLQIFGDRGWATGFVDSTPSWIFCGAQCWPDASHWAHINLPLNTQQLFAQVTCGDGNGCPRTTQFGLVNMKNVVVTVQDDTPPEVAITGGSATSNWWQNGDDVHVRFSAQDATGIRFARFFVDGLQNSAIGQPCDEALTRPCTQIAADHKLIPLSGAGEGARRLSIRVEDAGHNERTLERRLLIDRKPPPPPLNPQPIGPARWRAVNDFAIDWENPVQIGAPLTVAHARFCPAASKAGELARCAPEQTGPLRNGAGLTHLRVPREGDWKLLVWLEDAAGNAEPSSAAVVNGLGLDDSPPELSIAEPDDEDPARVRVTAKDDVSGIAKGQIEARHQGEDAWREMPTTLDARGFSAVMDDERLPKGRYEIRARAVDAAGNERSTDQQGNGRATRHLPLRLRTRLVVGKPARVRAQGAHGRKRYRTVLVIKPTTNFGRTIPLRGRLTTPGGNPLANAQVEVSQRTGLPSAHWRRIAMLRTARAGRFRFRALRGPSRTLRFRYPGTAKIRARSTEVDLGVRARSTIRVSRHRVVNGEDVTFAGRLMGRQYGDVGKLIYLQVYARGRWSTFATPRAHPSSGRWQQPYRFTATRGLVRYRFRALVPREAGYPYERGASRRLRVTVRGL